MKRTKKKLESVFLHDAYFCGFKEGFMLTKTAFIGSQMYLAEIFNWFPI